MKFRFTLRSHVIRNDPDIRQRGPHAVRVLHYAKDAICPDAPMISIRPYQSTDQSQLEWLHTRTPPAGQIAWRPFPIPADLGRIPEGFAHVLVAIEPIPEGEAVVGACAIADAGRAIGVPVPAFLDTGEPTAPPPRQGRA